MLPQSALNSNGESLVWGSSNLSGLILTTLSRRDFIHKPLIRVHRDSEPNLQL